MSTSINSEDITLNKHYKFKKYECDNEAASQSIIDTHATYNTKKCTIKMCGEINNQHMNILIQIINTSYDTIVTRIIIIPSIIITTNDDLRYRRKEKDSSYIFILS